MINHQQSKRITINGRECFARAVYFVNSDLYLEFTGTPSYTVETWPNLTQKTTTTHSVFGVKWVSDSVGTVQVEEAYHVCGERANDGMAIDCKAVVVGVERRMPDGWLVVRMRPIREAPPLGDRVPFVTVPITLHDTLNAHTTTQKVKEIVSAFYEGALRDTSPTYQQDRRTETWENPTSKSHLTMEGYGTLPEKLLKMLGWKRIE